MITLRYFSLLLVMAGLIACSSVDNKSTVVGRKVQWDYEQNSAVSIKEIDARIAAEPDNPQPYFLKGDHEERSGQLVVALDYYLKGMDRFKNVEGFAKDTRFTGGHYRVGRIYARLRGYNAAIIHLQLVVEMQPKKLAEAIQNDHFRESHFLLGACYMELLDYANSKKHFEAFLDLGGEFWRAGPHLSTVQKKIDEQK